MKATAQAVRERFLVLDSALIADVLDEFGLGHQALSPRFHALSGRQCVGWAYTIRGRSGPAPSGGDLKKMEACGGLGTGEVAVWAGDGEGIAYFGELIARGMAARGCVGALVQGAARDRRWLTEMGFPVFGLFETPVQSIGRWSVEDWQTPVELPGATCEAVVVTPGDLIFADEDGALVVPAEVVGRVLDRAEDLIVTEARVRKDLLAGSSLSEVLAVYGHV